MYITLKTHHSEPNALLEYVGLTCGWIPHTMCEACI